MTTTYIPKNRPPTHPGAFLLTGFLEPQGISVTAFAAHIGVSRIFLSGIVNGRRPLGVDMAMRLERATGVTVESWLQYQLARDVYEARHSQTTAAIRKIKPMKTKAA
jgi:antitoxin HigA-1